MTCLQTQAHTVSFLHFDTRASRTTDTPSHSYLASMEKDTGTEMHGIGRIPDEVGHLILSEDGAVIASGGELENAEQMGGTVMGILSCITKSQLWPADSGDAFKKLSITYSDHSYVVCLSNKNIHIVKRKFIPHEPVRV